MSLIQVARNSKGKFRVLVNYVQDGCELSSAIAANDKAKKLSVIYPKYVVVLFPVETTVTTETINHL
jgi:hypothetical protein